MAYCSDIKCITTSDSEIFKKTFTCGDKVPVSGIYKCEVCGMEYACNKGDPFTTQNHKQHPQGKDIVWRLLVGAGNN